MIIRNLMGSLLNSPTPFKERKEVCELVGVGKTKLYEIYKELEKYHVIKRMKLHNGTVIYFNPFLYSCGGLIDIETYNLFKDTGYNPINRQ